jgi:hypothetical protein
LGGAEDMISDEEWLVVDDGKKDGNFDWKEL